MKKLPLQINPCPIIEAILEIRFESDFPRDAIFGLTYNRFKDDYGDVEKLPILQLPSMVIDSDPQLKFNPHFKLKNKNKNIILQVGPNVFSLANIREYCGWKDFSIKIEDIYEKINDMKIINKEIRVALRYISVLDDIDIFKQSTLKLSIDGKDIAAKQLNIFAEIPYEKCTCNLRIVNSSELLIEDQLRKGSIVDVDVEIDIKKFETFKEAINYAHEKEKFLFFSLLNEEFLKTLNPIYER